MRRRIFDFADSLKGCFFIAGKELMQYGKNLIIQ